MRWKHQPACVVDARSVYTDESVLFQLDQCLEVLIKSGVLTRAPWYKTRCVSVLSPMCQVVAVYVSLIDGQSWQLVLELG